MPEKRYITSCPPGGPVENSNSNIQLTAPGRRTKPHRGLILIQARRPGRAAVQRCEYPWVYRSQSLH